MDYTKTNWQSGDVITAEKLNNMENGIEDASAAGANVIIVPMTVENNRLVMRLTSKEVYDYTAAGKYVVVYVEEEEAGELIFRFFPLVSAFHFPSGAYEYKTMIISKYNTFIPGVFTANSDSDKPSMAIN